MVIVIVCFPVRSLMLQKYIFAKTITKASERVKILFIASIDRTDSNGTIHSISFNFDFILF